MAERLTEEIESITVETYVDVVTVARCPRCGKSLERRVRISEVEVRTTNVDDAVARRIAGTRNDVMRDMDRRGWRNVCGVCRDTDDPAAAKEPKP